MKAKKICSVLQDNSPQKPNLSESLTNSSSSKPLINTSNKPSNKEWIGRAKADPRESLKATADNQSSLRLILEDQLTQKLKRAQGLKRSV